MKYTATEDLPLLEALTRIAPRAQKIPSVPGLKRGVSKWMKWPRLILQSLS